MPLLLIILSESDVEKSALIFAVAFNAVAFTNAEKFENEVVEITANDCNGLGCPLIRGAILVISLDDFVYGYIEVL